MTFLPAMLTAPASRPIKLLHGLLLLGVLLWLPATVTGQQTLVDSLRQQWSSKNIGTDQLTQLLELVEKTSQKDLKETIALTDYGLSLAEDLGKDAWIVKFLIEKGGALQRQSAFDAALEVHERSVEISRAIGNDGLLTQCLNNKAVVLIDQGDYHGGLQLHLEVLRVREKTGSQDELGYSCNYVSEDLYFLERFPESVKYAERAIALFKAAGNMEGLAIAYENIAWSI